MKNKVITLLIAGMVAASMASCGFNQGSSIPESSSVESGSADAGEVVDYKSEKIVEREIDNPAGGESLIVNVWEGDDLTYDEVDEDGCTNGSSYANNVGIIYHAEEDDDESLEDHTTSRIEEVFNDQLSADSFRVDFIKADKENDAVKAHLEYGTPSYTVQHYIENKREGGSIVTIEIMYYSDADEYSGDILADSKYAAMALEAYDLDKVTGDDIEIPSAVKQTEFELYEKEISDKSGSVSAKCYTWDKDQKLDSELYETEEPSTEIPSSETEANSEIPSSEDPVEEEEQPYIDSFTTSLRGIYATAEVYRGEDEDMTEVVRNYKDSLGYYVSEGAKASQIEGDKKDASMTAIYSIGKSDCMIVYAAKQIKGGYQVISVINSTGNAENVYFRQILDAYGVKVSEPTEEIEVPEYPMEDETEPEARAE